MSSAPAEVGIAPSRHRAIATPPGDAPRAASKTITIAMVLVIGVALVTGGNPGIGFIVTRLVAYAAFLTLGVRQVARAGGREERLRELRMWLLSAVSLTLTSIGAQRAADWVFLVCLIGSLLTGSLALAGGSTFLGIMRGSVATWIAGVRRWPWFLRGIAGVWQRALRGRGFGIQVACLCVAGLAGAGLIAAMIIGAIDAWHVIIVVGVVGSLTVGGMYVLATRPDMDPRWTAHRGLRTPIWAVPVALLDIAVLGHAVLYIGGMLRLAAVVVAASIAVAAVATFAPRETTAQQITQRLLLGPLCVGVLLHTGVAFRAIGDQLDASGLTRGRLGALAAIIFVAATYALILAAGITLRGRWLPKAVYGVATAVLIGLAAINPDAVIARTNIDHGVRPEYLTTLSADAIDELDGLPEPWRSCALRNVQAQLAEPDGWFDYNYGRAHARDVLSAHPVDDSVGC